MNIKAGSQASREALAQKILLGCGVFGAVVGASSVFLQRLDVTLSRPLLFVGTLVVLAVGALVTAIYWRSIDEAAREAHKFAWFWGGSAGMLVMLPLGVLIGSERLVAVMGERTPGQWVFFGISSLLIAQITGYGLVWSGWWLRQR